MDVSQVDSIPLQSRVALNLNFVFAHRQFIQGDFFLLMRGKRGMCHQFVTETQGLTEKPAV